MTFSADNVGRSENAT